MKFKRKLRNSLTKQDIRVSNSFYGGSLNFVSHFQDVKTVACLYDSFYECTEEERKGWKHFLWSLIEASGECEVDEVSVMIWGSFGSWREVSEDDQFLKVLGWFNKRDLLPSFLGICGNCKSSLNSHALLNQFLHKINLNLQQSSLAFNLAIQSETSSCVVNGYHPTEFQWKPSRISFSWSFLVEKLRSVSLKT